MIYMCICFLQKSKKKIPLEQITWLHTGISTITIRPINQPIILELQTIGPLLVIRKFMSMPLSIN